MSRLQAAHLISEHELWALGLRERYLLDERGLVALCKPCHGCLDVFVARVRDLRWMSERRAAQLLQWWRRSAVQDGLWRLGRRRTEWLAVTLREVDGDGSAGGSR